MVLADVVVSGTAVPISGGSWKERAHVILLKVALKHEIILNTFLIFN